MSEFKRYTNEQIEQANNMDIVDFLYMQGYEIKKTGNDSLKVPHHQGLLITPSKNAWSWQSRPPAPEQRPDARCLGGVGVLSFCQRVMDMPFQDAMKMLVGEAAEIKQFTSKAVYEPQEKKEFVMPEKDDNGYKQMYAYFIKTRSISPETIREFVNKGLLYPTVSKGISKTTGKEYSNVNAVFLHKNEQGQPCGADLQGTNPNPEYRFKGCTARDESDRGFVYDKGNSEKIDTVYLFEAVIDLMSFVELHPEIENAKFVALSGLKPATAAHYIDSDMKVISCVDNDSAGQAFNNRILSSKMQQSLSSNGDDITAKTVKDREPPITFLEATVNGRECSFFLSKDDYKGAAALKADIRSSVFIWVNKSNFTVNRECAEAGVKDFNDLLKDVKFRAATDRVMETAAEISARAAEKNEQSRTSENRNSR